MNFGNFFHVRRARSRTFSGETKVREPKKLVKRSCSETGSPLPDGPNPEANKYTNDGGLALRYQSSNSEGLRTTGFTSSVQKLTVGSAAGRGDSRNDFAKCYAGLRRKSLSTSNLLVSSTVKPQSLMEYDLSVMQTRGESKSLFREESRRTETEPQLRLETGKETEKTGLRRSVSFLKETELYIAIVSDDVQEVQRLLTERGMDPNRTLNALTLLHHAAIEGSYCCLNLLLSHGAGVNTRDRNGWTPLHDAVFHGHVRCALALLTAGADVEAETTEFVRPIEMAEDDAMILIIGRAMTLCHEGSSSNPDRETLV